MTADKIVSLTSAPRCQEDGAMTVVTDEQMYTAFAAEHLATACRCLSQAIDEQPELLAYLRPMLERWRRDVATLEAEAKTKVVGDRP